MRLKRRILEHRMKRMTAAGECQHTVCYRHSARDPDPRERS